MRDSNGKLPVAFRTREPTFAPIGRGARGPRRSGRTTVGRRGSMLLLRFDLWSERLDCDLAVPNQKRIRGEHDVRGCAVRVPYDVDNVVGDVQRVDREFVGPGLEQRGNYAFEEPTNRRLAVKRTVGTDQGRVVGVIAEDAVKIAGAKSAEVMFENLPSRFDLSCHRPPPEYESERAESTRSRRAGQTTRLTIQRHLVTSRGRSRKRRSHTLSADVVSVLWRDCGVEDLTFRREHFIG